MKSDLEKLTAQLLELTARHGARRVWQAVSASGTACECKFETHPRVKCFRTRREAAAEVRRLKQVAKVGEIPETCRRCRKPRRVVNLVVNRPLWPEIEIGMLQLISQDIGGAIVRRLEAPSNVPGMAG